MDPMITALVILIITIILFIWEPIPIIVTAIGASIAYAYTGIIEVGDIFTGYNSDTIVLLAGMMVIGSSLFHAGITDMIGEKMIKITGKSERNIILATLIVSCTISSVCSNIGVMTAMAPLVTAMCLAAGIGPSKALLALLFGAQFGGFVTLVGVGSNATANSVMEQMGITPFGIGVCVLGTLYFTFVGRKFIPDTGYVPEFAQTDRKPLDKKKAVIAVVTLLCVLVVIAASPDNIPMHVAAVVGALVIVGTKCMTVQEAIKAIDWNCMLLVGSLTAISPDVTPRKCDDLELARRLQAAGMAGCAIKSHYMDTSGRAALLQKLYPELTFAGGVTLNRSVGGVNPQAVERMGQMGGKMLWFPTLEARAYQRFHHADDGTGLSQFLTVLDEDGKLLPQAVEVLEAAAQYKLVVGTGHLSAREGLALVREARRLDGLQMVLTHADNPADQYTLEQQQQAVRAGAMVEHCYFTTYYNRVSAQEIARQIQGVGPEHVILSTDFGQVKSPYSDEGMLGYMEALYACGVSEDALVQMTRTNPQRLIAS